MQVKKFPSACEKYSEALLLCDAYLKEQLTLKGKNDSKRANRIVTSILSATELDKDVIHPEHSVLLLNRSLSCQQMGLWRDALLDAEVEILLERPVPL